nr:MAG TPA: hypothetical protein [Caudoviricetes sp.]
MSLARMMAVRRSCNSDFVIFSLLAFLHVLL